MTGSAKYLNGATLTVACADRRAVLGCRNGPTRWGLATGAGFRARRPKTGLATIDVSPVARPRVASGRFFRTARAAPNQGEPVSTGVVNVIRKSRAAIPRSGVAGSRR